MNKKYIPYFVGSAVLILIFSIIKSTFNQTGIENMKAGFKEIAQYRNDNNTGPVQRIYVVTIKDSIWSEMEAYGNFMPHTKYGNTKVYFFMENSNVPKNLEPGEVNFDNRFNKNCIALYEKSAMRECKINCVKS